MILKFKKTIYPKVVLIKAAYHFTPRAYLHLDEDDSYYIVEINSKEDGSIMPNKGEFENEILSQVARFEIFQQTKDIRKIALARALSSSVVERRLDEETGMDAQRSVSADDILQNWFENSQRK